MEMTKKKSDEFVKQFCERIVSEVGAVETKSILESTRTFELETKVGTLHIMIPKTQNNLFMVFARFENIKRASKLFSCNPNSGKYNFSMSAIDNVNNAVNGVIEIYKNTLY